MLVVCFLRKRSCDFVRESATARKGLASAQTMKLPNFTSASCCSGLSTLLKSTSARSFRWPLLFLPTISSTSVYHFHASVSINSCTLLGRVREGNLSSSSRVLISVTPKRNEARRGAHERSVVITSVCIYSSTSLLPSIALSLTPRQLPLPTIFAILTSTIF